MVDFYDHIDQPYCIITHTFYKSPSPNATDSEEAAIFKYDLITDKPKYQAEQCALIQRNSQPIQLSAPLLD